MKVMQAMRDLQPVNAIAGVLKPRSYYDKSWALVVGIDDYGDRQPQLANARRDAEAVAKLLQTDYAFEHVTTLYDSEATRAALMALLRDDLPTQVGSNDRLIFFFAGHGNTRKGIAGQERGYLVPHDAATGKYADYVDMAELRDACGFIPAKHIFILLDCCFSGVAAVTTRAAPGDGSQVLTDSYLKRVTERRAWQVLTAGASDELAADSGSRPGHSAFTSALLAGLEGQADQNSDGIITASELANYVKPEVSRETSIGGSAGQTPFFSWMAGSEQGDFVFLRPDRPIRIASSGRVWQQATPILQLPHWLVGVLAAIVLVVGILGWYVYDGNRQARRLQEQLGPVLTREAAATATAAAIASAPTATTTPTATPTTVAAIVPTLAPTALSTAPATAPTLTTQPDRAATAFAATRLAQAPTRPAAATLATLAATPLRPVGLSYTGQGVKVALFGTGIDANHPDLRGRIANVQDLTDEGIQEDIGYGTFLAGVVAGTGSASQGQNSGLAPAARLYVVKISAASGGSSTAALMQGIQWALDQDVDVLLVPYGNAANCDGSDPVSTFLDEATDRGVVVVVSGGNGSSVGMPGCADAVITVGFVDEFGAIFSSSGRGPTLDGRRKPDLVGPGTLVSVRGANTNTGSVVDTYYTRVTGSGTAAAYVAGMVALMLEARPELTPVRVKELLMETATDLGADDQAQGAGLVDLDAALHAVVGDLPVQKIERDAAYAIRYLNQLFGTSVETPSLVLLEETSYNTFWDGQRYHAPPEVQYLADFTYHYMAYPVLQSVVQLSAQGQSGAIQNSYATIFSALVKQHRLGQTAASADWLFAPGAVAWLKHERDLLSAPNQAALRSLAAPGTAYDDPVLGKDPQVAHMDAYVETSEDMGGVHINSGIPNRAFYETAMRVGTTSAGQIWFGALRLLEPTSDFQSLADATARSARLLFGPRSVEQRAVEDAWAAVGITTAATHSSTVISPTATELPTLLTPTAGQTRINPVDGAVYVYVPAGLFTMGSVEAEGVPHDRPQHTVYLDAYWIGRTEVTNAQYQRCVDAKIAGDETACDPPDNVTWALSQNANRPVTHVTWAQAETYARWVGGRLPSEAQWEKACRGTDGRVYPWGDQEPNSQLLNYAGNEVGTTDVGSYPDGASPYGALDMAGNVFEWVSDWYGANYDAESPPGNPEGPETGDLRVLRGGSWHGYVQDVRCAARHWGDYFDWLGHVGFRVASLGF